MYQRTETFVIEFSNQEAFKKIFDLISKATPEKDGFFMKVAEKGNPYDRLSALEDYAYIVASNEGEKVSPELEARICKILGI